jgi:uncharacterized membrane protein
MSDATFVLVAATAALSALVGGVFFAFSNFVMAALARIDAREGIAAMQSINVTVINPLFMSALFGTGLLSLALVGVAISDLDADYAPYLLAGGIVYFVGEVVVTMAFNVPRNNALERMDRDDPESPRLWRSFVREWTAWNHVRTVSGLAAALLEIGAIRLG